MQTRENFIFFLMGSSTNEILNNFIQYHGEHTYISKNSFRKTVITHINHILIASNLDMLTKEEESNFDTSQKYLDYLQDKTINSY